jgi:hypothetical protein
MANGDHPGGELRHSPRTASELACRAGAEQGMES